MDERHLLDEQIAYYRARANEYDEWFLRTGRYDRGPKFRQTWLREAAEIEGVLRSTVHDSDVLEFACGTGLWTRHLAENNRGVVAVDASPEVIAINRERVGSAKVEYRVAEIFSWVPTPTFDVVFFSFWLSHVPPARFDEFWSFVQAALKPGGRAFFIDSLMEQTSSARDHAPLDESGMSQRKVNDGREFNIVKIFYQPSALEERLTRMGWTGWVRSTRTFFLYGSMTRPIELPA
jgi:SAM-dependent methyltransferase